MGTTSNYSLELARKAKSVTSRMRVLDQRQKNHILKSLAALLRQNTKEILSANAKDIEAGEQTDLGRALLDRLKLNENRIESIAQGVEDIIQLPDPVGESGEFRVLENGIRIGQVKVPLGVVLVIYESRPNVTIDVAALCIKSGNVAILRGGKEAVNTNGIFVKLLGTAFQENGHDPMAFFVDRVERDIINDLLKMNQFIDIVVPRGGPGLIKTVSENSTIPVIKHDAGLCHIFLAEDAEYEMARDVILNAKTQRPGTCNAAETLLIEKEFSHSREILQDLIDAGVKLKGCQLSRNLIPEIDAASEEDYATEWLDMIMNVKFVENMDEAIDHIERFSSEHSEAILSNNYNKIGSFLQRVDSAALFVNCSTRFHDGGQFGLGAEVGISTQKLHVRGPMGLEHLTTMKYIVLGQGQIRE